MIKFSKKIPIYFGTLVIVVNDNIPESIRYLKIKDINPDNYNDCFGLSVSTCVNSKTIYAILLQSKPTHSLIAHEALHITHDIIRNISATSDIHNDETTCYLLDWIVEQIYTGLDKNNIKITIK